MRSNWGLSKKLCDWLTKLWQKTDKGLLIVILIGTLSAWPFFEYRGLPEATDAELHIFRIAELGFSLKAGNFYPRWAPNFYSGYGYPIFNYYAPLTYHLGNWVTFFHPENAVLGAKILFVLSHYLGAWGAYLLGREFSNQVGGVLGSAAFAFSPYIMLINPHIRGDLAEVFALAIVPWALWYWERLWYDGGHTVFVGAIISATTVLLSHNLTGLSLMVILLLMSLWHWLIQKRYTRFTWALAAGLLIVALTAYFWLPFLVERNYVQLDNVVDKDHYDFTKHFVPVFELLSLLPAQDWRATTIKVPMSAGLPIVISALVGTLIALKRNFKRVFFYIVMSAVCFWLITRSSFLVWQTIPGFDFFQFPWRFLGPFAALTTPIIAVLGNLSFSKPKYFCENTKSTNGKKDLAPLRLYVRNFRALLVNSVNGDSYIITVVLLAIIIAAIPGWYVLPWNSNFGKISPASYMEFENRGHWRGTTSTNDFVPRTVEMLPAPQLEVVQSYKQGVVDRVNRYTIPRDAIVSIVQDVPWRNHFYVSTPNKFVLRLYLFYFPGWQAYIDGQSVPIEIAKPEGFITVKIPPGEHTVLIQFEDTLPRKLGWGISILGIILGGIALYIFPTKITPKTTSCVTKNNFSLNLIAMVLLGLVSAKLTFLDTLTWFHYTSPLGEAQSTQYRQSADFSDKIVLLGYDVSNPPNFTGRVNVTLYWQAKRPLTNTYQSFVHIVYPEGEIWAQSDNLNPGDFPTNRWPTDRYIRDHHQLTLPKTVPPGEYKISIGLYTLHNQQRLNVLLAEYGNRKNNVILRQTIKVKK